MRLVLDMKINKQFLRISVAMLLLSLVRRILATVSSYYFSSVIVPLPIDGGVQIFWWNNFVNSVVKVVIIPIVIFAVFYFIGKKPDTTFEPRQILLALVIGNMVAHVVGSIVYSAIVLDITVASILQVLLESTLNYFVVDLLVALGGLSMGLIRRKKFTLNAEPDRT